MLEACRLKLGFLTLVIPRIRRCEELRVLPLLIFKKDSGLMMLPSYALYKKLYLLSFIILFYLSIVAEA
jgi:hypothetical protein